MTTRDPNTPRADDSAGDTVTQPGPPPSEQADSGESDIITSAPQEPVPVAVDRASGVDDSRVFADTDDAVPFADDESSGVITGVVTLPFDLGAAFIGHRDVLDRLRAAFARVHQDRALAFVVVVGEPGMGKSRTIKELAAEVRRQVPGTRFLIADGDDSGIAYAAFARLLARRFGIPSGTSGPVCRERITAGVAEVLPGPRVTEVAHLLAHLMRVPFPDSAVIGPLSGAPQQLQTRTFLAMRRFLAADATEAPLVLCIENLEGCGAESINLLNYLAAGLVSAPVLLLGTARDSLFQRYPSFGAGEVAAERIDIGPLAPDEVQSMLQTLCEPLGEIPPRIQDHARRLGGSPRAILELMRLLLECGVIARAGTRWRVDPDRLATARLPRSYDELVAERLAVMPRPERGLLEKAAVVGETFWLDAAVALVRAEALAGDDPDGPTLREIAASGSHSRNAIAAALAALVDRDWLVEVPDSSVPGEREYRFANANLWRLVAGGIDDIRRELYHRTVAQWLELRPEGRGPSAQEDVAQHLERAGDLSGAAARYRRAADVARAQFFNDRAIGLYQRALACIGEADLAARIHVWHDMGSIYELKGEFEHALAAFERVLRLSWVVAARTKAAVAFNKMGRVWRRKGDLSLALEYLERGRELFEQAGDTRGISSSLDDIGKTLYNLSRYDEAVQKVTAGLELRGAGGDPRSIAASLSSLGNIHKSRGQFDDAESCHRRALELRRGIRDRWGVTVSLNNLAVLAYEHGDFDAAKAGWTQALDEAEDIGALPLAARALNNLGELALMQGGHDEARSRLEDALELAGDLDDKRLQVETRRNLALLENAVGNVARARALAERAHAIAAAAGLRDAEGRALLCLGEVLAQELFDAGEPELPVSGAMSESGPTANRADADADADSGSAKADRDDGGDDGDDGDESVAAGVAEDYFRRGIEILREIGNESELARGLEQLGRYKIERGDHLVGKDLLREALVIYSKLDMNRGEEVEKLLASV